jgi:hypothetical protein
MMKIQKFLQTNWRSILLITVGLVLLCGLFLYRLASLPEGLSRAEVLAANLPLGWHGLYHHPLYLPLDVVRSVVFKLSGHHSQWLIRFPNVVVGMLAVVCFSVVVYVWHGFRTTLFATLLFACASWTLHVSRLASFDVMYLAALPALLLTNVVFHRQSKRLSVYYGSLIAWSLLIYIPGMVWFVLLNGWWLRRELAAGWLHLQPLWHKLVACLLAIAWVPLLVIAFIHSSVSLSQWLGLPAKWGSALTILKQFVAVLIHIFGRGPQYPALWLGKAPLLDIFTLVAVLLGIYFYTTHFRAARSRILFSFFGLGVILVALNGPVALSLVIPLLFVWAAAGVAYLLHKWLSVFPLNPLARGVGIALISLAVAASCIYNIRSYFVAWPHAPITQAIFEQRP